MEKITDTNEFIEIASIVSKSDVSEKDCMYITHFLIDLQHQLEEKDKVIDEAREYLVKWGEQPDADMYLRINEYKEYTELLKILERGNK